MAAFLFPFEALLQAKILDRGIVGPLKAIEMGLNGVPVARHGLILRQHGATAPSMLLIWVLFLYDSLLYRFVNELVLRG